MDKEPNNSALIPIIIIVLIVVAGIVASVIIYNNSEELKIAVHTVATGNEGIVKEIVCIRTCRALLDNGWYIDLNVLTLNGEKVCEYHFSGKYSNHKYWSHCGE